MATSAQKSPVIKSLDDFFTGIPLQSGFPKWMEYISSDSTLALDSSKSWGFYSSIKHNRSHFPFDTDIPVRIIFHEDAQRFDKPEAISYQKEMIMIDGLFPGNTAGKKASIQCFNELKAQLKQYYSKHKQDQKEIEFLKSDDPNFPPFSLRRGEPGHGFNFYYVMLEYIRVVKLEK